jgi:cytochrome c peroxidase
MSRDAYNRLPDPFVITRALATFERTLVSGNAPVDLYQNGNKSALSESQIRGMNLFYSNQTNCSSCHGGFNFTNHDFENNGLYVDYPDNGRERLTNNPADRALFKTPSLRNVALTPPYMHDGSISTLKDVIEHYNSGGHSHPNKSALIKPLNLTAEEKEDLIHFLESLTDQTFVSNPAFYP